MADDGLGLEAQPAPAPNGATANAAPAPTPDVNAAVQSAMEPFAQALQGINDQLGALAQATRASTPAPAQSGDEMVSNLLTNPEKVIAEQVDVRTRTTIGPAMRMLLDDKREAALAQHRVDIDSKYGEGAFDELIDPKLTPAIKDLPVEMVASTGHLNVLIDSIKGRDEVAAKLADRRTAVVAAAAKANLPPPSLLDGGVSPGREPTIDQDLKDFVAVWNHETGDSETAQGMVDTMKRGNTEEDWPREDPK